MSGRYRLRDAFMPPGLLSLARIPLGAAFALVVDRTPAALAVLALAGLTDVLDGWWARRFRQATATGAALDGITDKLFALTVAVTLLVHGHLTVAALLLLNVRELCELPLVIWTATSHRVRLARVEGPRANLVGKLATVLQFAAIASALLHARHTDAWIAGTAVAGGVAAGMYWRRELRAHRPRSIPRSS